MKQIIIAIILIGLCGTLALAKGGDLGGGSGAISKTVQLSQGEINQLKNLNDSSRAYQKWVHMLDIKQQEQLMEIIFEHHVLPQIKK